MSQFSRLATAPSKSLAIKHYFCTLRDPRRRHRRLHRLLDIVAIAICAVICGADNWQEIATFGQRRRTWLIVTTVIYALGGAIIGFFVLAMLPHAAGAAMTGTVA